MSVGVGTLMTPKIARTAEPGFGVRSPVVRSNGRAELARRISRVALIAASCIGAMAWAQAGGYSAGPGLSERRAVEVDGGPRPSPFASGPAPTPAPNADGGTSAETSVPDENFTTLVVGHRPSPAFTQDREFTTTRVWVLDPGKFTVEQWWNGFWGAPAAQPNPYPNDQFFQTEIEMGVAPHLQVDIYANYEFDQDSSGNYQVAKGGHTGVAAELRVALPSYWGQFPGNPTLYFELTSQYYNSPRAEVRLLLGDTILTPKLLAALNLAFERNIFRDSATGIDYEIKADLGVNYEVVKDILRIGVESVLGFDSHGTIDAEGHTLIHPVAEVGPSLLLSEPRKRLKLLAALLRGFASWDQPWNSTVILSTTW
jgi:hypothetical protein